MELDPVTAKGKQKPVIAHDRDGLNNQQWHTAAALFYVKKQKVSERSTQYVQLEGEGWPGLGENDPRGQHRKLRRKK